MERNSSEINWNKLGFQYRKVNSLIRYTWENGKWNDGIVQESDRIEISLAATCLHYGQSCFEGLKAFAQKNGGVSIFRANMNAERMQHSAKRILAPEVPKEMFIGALRQVVENNIEYVPPYETGGALYLRPFLFGSGEQLGLKPSEKYEFVVMAVPVGPYYQNGAEAVDALVMDDFDRAAPNGTGKYKISTNYAASLYPQYLSNKKGYDISLFLDAKSHKYIDEFGTSNFIGIHKNGSYVTPQSETILESITNKSLIQIAEDSGMNVEKRPVHISELEDFTEVGACGTAVVITPVGTITRKNKIISYDVEGFGPVLNDLHSKMTSIQRGEIEDSYNWLLKVK